MPKTSLSFPPFRLDLEDQRLWNGHVFLELRRKPFAILRYLAEHPNRLVTHEELVKAVWGSIVVGEGAIRTQVYDLRRFLGKGIIETVVGRGYRFSLRVTQSESPTEAVDVLPADPPEWVTSSPGTDPTSPRLSAQPRGAGPGDPFVEQPPLGPRWIPLVGRAAELRAMRAIRSQAATGERQILFVTGDPGIGKSTLVSAFIAELPEGTAFVVRGQCVEQSGLGEPYFPLLEGLRRLCESPGGQRVMTVLARRAPTWLRQMPGLLPDGELAALQQRTAGTTQERMVRELCEALEQISADRPVVLVLEDLQWSDLSTINVISVLGARRGPARLMLVGTARQANVLQPEHPLNTAYRELLARGYARVVTPGALTADEVSEYLRQRFSHHDFPGRLAVAIHGLTAGTPLFLVSVVDDLVRQNALGEVHGRWSLRVRVESVAASRPAHIHQLLDVQLDRLGPTEQRVLEIASLVGMEFSVGLVAAAQTGDASDAVRGDLAGAGSDEIDDLCERLVRREHVIRAMGVETWPDGTVHSRYAFRHGVYQAVALKRSSPGRRQLWHRRIAERLLTGYASSTGDVAGELAFHFDGARQSLQAALYHAMAGERASAGFAGLDATVRFKAGLHSLEQAPPSAERDALELRLLSGLAPRLMERELGSSAVSTAYARIRTLLAGSPDETGRDPWPAVFGDWIRSFLAPEGRFFWEGAEELVAQAEERRDLELITATTSVLATATFLRGDLPRAQGLLERLSALFKNLVSGEYGTFEPKYPDTFVVTAVPLRAVTLWLLGYPDQAANLCDRDAEWWQAATNPLSQTLNWNDTARLHYWRNDPDKVRASAERVRQISDTHGFAAFREEGEILFAWAEVMTSGERGGLEAVQDVLARRTTDLPPRGSTFDAVVFGDICLSLGELESGLTVLDRYIQFSEASGERVYLPELYRLKGALLGPRDRLAAEGCVARALQMARQSSARSLELRAALTMVRLRQGGGDHEKALALLREVEGRFTEGSATLDRVEATRLLAAGAGAAVRMSHTLFPQTRRRSPRA